MGLRRRVLASLGLVVALGAACSDVVAAQQARPPASLDALVDSVRLEFDLPALGGAIVTLDRGVIAMGVAGTRRASGGPPVSTADRWHLGSDFKAFTAMLGAIAVDQHKLSWTTTLSDAFPELGASMREEYRAVTFRDLLSHQGGIPRDVAGRVPGATGPERRSTVARWALTQPPANPRGIYAYSNVGYIVAAAMIERAYGGSFEDVMAERLFRPLGITDAGFGPQADSGSTTQPVAHRRTPDGGWRELEALDNQPVYSAAGGAYMSLASWGAFVREVLRAEAGTSTVVSPLSARETTNAQVTMGTADSYGMGWIVSSRDWAHGRTLSHTGSNTANLALAWVAPRRGVAFLAVTNSFDTSSEALSARGADALVGRMLAWFEKNAK